MNLIKHGYSNKILIIIFYLQWISVPFEAKHVVGELRSTEKWEFLARFCFLSRVGTFEFDVKYPLSFAPQNLLLYFDTESQWSAVYRSDKTCEEKEQVMIKGNKQIINLTLAGQYVDCKVLRDDDAKPYYRCRGIRSFKSSRERWWYIAVSKCDGTKGLSLEYSLLMTNGYSYWYRHFSADEFCPSDYDLAVC